MIGQLAAFVLFGLSLVIVARVVDKAGYSPWWSLLLFVPLGNLAGLWVLAFIRWPALEEGGRPRHT